MTINLRDPRKAVKRKKFLFFPVPPRAHFVPPASPCLGFLAHIGKGVPCTFDGLADLIGGKILAFLECRFPLHQINSYIFHPGKVCQSFRHGHYTMLAAHPANSNRLHFFILSKKQTSLRNSSFLQILLKKYHIVLIFSNFNGTLLGSPPPRHPFTEIQLPLRQKKRAKSLSGNPRVRRSFKEKQVE
jgi:hypothetical protein